MSEEAKVGLGLYAEGYHAGLEKAKADMRSFEGQTNRSLGNTQKSFDGVSKSTGMGAEKITKYGTAVNALAGNTSLLGVKNDALSKSIAVVSDAMSGMMSGVGLAVVGIGALAAGIGYLISQHKKWNEELKKNEGTLLDLVAKAGIGGQLQSIVISGMESSLKAEKAKLEATLADMQRSLDVGLFSGGPLLDKLRGRDSMEDLRGKAAAAAIKLAEVNAELAKIQQARWVDRTLQQIEVRGQRPGRDQAVPGRSRLPGVPSGGEMYGPNSILSQLRMGSWAQPGFDSPDIARQIAEPHLTANELILESYDRMSVGVQAAYQGMHGTMRGLIQGTSDLVAAAVMGENLERLKGLDIAMYVAGQGAAAALRAIGDVSAKRATEAAALGFLKIAEGTFGLKGAAAGFKAAGLYGILAGGAYGLAAGIEGRTKLEIGRSAEKAGIDSSGSSSTSSSGFSSSGGWGAQVAPTTVTYAPQLIINGNGYFGSDADRELARRLIPMLEQAMALRSN